jgi:hypothetical protein
METIHFILMSDGAPLGLDSRIVSGFPRLFRKFNGKAFSLLWRGSRDGFNADCFHNRCDGHANTLTIILDTNKNIFGGFTPVQLDSPRQWHSKPDPSLESFLFTLENPHGVPARIFVMNTERTNEALWCDSMCGPHFGDAYVRNDWIGQSSTRFFGSSYVNDTGFPGNTFLTGSEEFQVEEIEVFEIIPAPTHSPLGSVIISTLPEILAEFHGKVFSLLWRGSRDGFDAHVFLSRCEGHANTLTIILDTNGNIFGGFTPLKWEWHEDHYLKADPSLKSFLFTLKNPHNFPARRFALKAEKKDEAIWCSCRNISGCVDPRGPAFGNDIRVSPNCNADTKSYTSLGCVYTNDTNLDGTKFFTGSRDFQVKEIEIYEITE